MRHAFYFAYILFILPCYALALSCDFSKAPLCPQSGSTLLDDTFPVGSFVMSASYIQVDSEGNNVSKLPPSEKIPTEFAYKILKAYSKSDRIPAIIFPTKDAEFMKVKQDLTAKLLQDGMSEKQIEKILSSLVHVNVTPYTWQQDYFESFVDLKTGQPQLRGVASYAQTQKKFPKDSLEKLLSSSPCLQKGPDLVSDLQVRGKDTQLDTKRSWGNGEYGGNIEGLPGGLCMIGNNASLKYSSQFCGDNDNSVQIDVSWLQVGHVDEVIKVIPNNDPNLPKECRFSLMVASPEKAMDDLKSPSNANKLFMPDIEKQYESDKSATSRFLNHKGLGPICKLLLTQDEINKSKKDVKSSSGVKTTLINFYNFLFIARAQAGAETEIKDMTPECVQIMKIQTNAQIYDLLISANHDSGVARDFNLQVEKIMQQNTEKVVTNIKKRLPNCKSIDVMKVPQLFTSADLVEGELPEPGSSFSLLPNPTNAVVANDTLIVPEQFVGAYQNSLSEDLKKRGLKVDYIDTFEYAHSIEGNIHCSSHSIPYCTPR